MSTTTTSAIAILTNYTQALEDALALTLVGQTAGASVIFNTDLNVARIWNGSLFENTPTPPVDSSLVIIRQLSDFPTPVADVITLDSYTTYQISGTIDIGINRIVCGIKNTILGLDRLNDVLLSSTTGNMITVDSSSVAKLSFITNTITLQCPNGTLFNFTGGSANQLTLISTTISNTKTLGGLDGVALSIRTCSVTNLTTNGFAITGNNTSLILRDSTVSNNTGTFFDLSSCSAISAIGISRSYITSNATQTFFNGTGLAVSLNAQINLCSFAGAGTFLTGITAQTTNWLFVQNIGITNTVNGNSQLIETTSAGKYPALDGSLITNVASTI